MGGERTRWVDGEQKPRKARPMGGEKKSKGDAWVNKKNPKARPMGREKQNAKGATNG